MSVDTNFELYTVSAYRDGLVPAARKFEGTGDISGLCQLLAEGKKRLVRDPIAKAEAGALFYDPEGLQNSIDILNGREFYGPSSNHIPPHPGAKTTPEDLKIYVRFSVYDEIFDTTCIAYNPSVRANQVLTRGRLLWYLYEQSSFFEMAFAGGGLHGVQLEYVDGETLSTKDLTDLLDHLLVVQPPDDEAEREKERKKLDAAQKSGKRFILRSDVDLLAIYGDPVSKQLEDLKKLLQRAFSQPGLAIAQFFG